MPEEIKGIRLTLHRLLNQHKWEDVDERKVKGVTGAIELSGVVTNDFVNNLREGYTIIHQKCPLCGDHRKVRV